MAAGVRNQGRWLAAVGWVSVIALVAAGALASAGYGQAPAPGVSTATAVAAQTTGSTVTTAAAPTTGSTVTTAAAPTTGSTVTTAAAPTTGLAQSPSSSEPPTATEARNAEELFARLATAAAPMAIFAPSALPAGTTLADTWLPVLDSQQPEAYTGPPASNPKVGGSGADTEIEVVFQVGDGWLAVLENFRGDLGDVKGAPVDDVAGRPAALYQVNGGELVQWSKDGLWYGVFGRGISRHDLLSVADGMREVSSLGA